MKTTIKTLSIIAMALVLFQPKSLNSQPTYNSAVLDVDSSYSYATIRAYSANITILCHHSSSTSPTTPWLIMTDITTGTSRYIELQPGYVVSDMRIYNGFVFFCGSTAGGEASYGFVDINSFWTLPPATFNVEYRNFPNTLGHGVLTHLQVYHDGTSEKLVALGYETYTGTAPVMIPPSASGSYASCLSSSCREYFVVECTNPRSSAPALDYLLVNTVNNNEYLSDMVLTNSYVAIVGYDANTSMSVYIHRCKRYDVLNTFSDRHEYSIPYCVSFTGLKCCAMKGDTIAIANISDNSGNYGIRLRVVDVASMNMTCAQELPKTGKTDIFDMVYYPQHQMLLLSTYFDILPYAPYYGDDWVFMRVEPYNTNAYTTTGIIETIRRYEYRSMDMIANDYFVASGGGFGFAKNAITDISSPGCYVTRGWDVKQIVKLYIDPSPQTYDIGNDNFVLDNSLRQSNFLGTLVRCSW